MFLAVAGLALVHAFSVKLRFLDKIPRCRWLSFAGDSHLAGLDKGAVPVLTSRRFSKMLEGMTADHSAGALAIGPDVPKS